MIRWRNRFTISYNIGDMIGSFLNGVRRTSSFAKRFLELIRSNTDHPSFRLLFPELISAITDHASPKWQSLPTPCWT